MRAAVIHPSLDVRLLVSQYLAMHWPEVEVMDATPADWRGASVEGTDYFVVGEETVAALIELLTEVKQRVGPIPIICLGPQGHARHERELLELGVKEYRALDQLTRVNIREMVERALAEQTAGEDTDRTDLLVFSGEVDFESGTTEFVMNGKPVRIRGYTLQEQIGEGGMSRVFSAVRDADGQELVLKVMDGAMMQDELQLERFMHEYRIVAQIDSRWVVKIYDQGFTDDHVFIAMERFPGGDLKRLLGQPFVPKRAVALLWEIGMALHSIHRLGIVHRDMKPQNIMFRADRTLALLDFGVSRMESVQMSLTQIGELVGTPLYMSPEQAKGQNTDARSDLYSVGTIFYEMLTGKRVFTARSLMMIIHMHATEPAPPLPAPLQAMQELVDRLLAKDPIDRFQSAQEMLHYIKRRWGEKSRLALPAAAATGESTVPAILAMTANKRA